eukprot:SAG31_NODE_1348_length_8693_cov_4.345008_5_plen_36_part_00
MTMTEMQLEEALVTRARSVWSEHTRGFEPRGADID